MPGVEEKAGDDGARMAKGYQKTAEDRDPQCRSYSCRNAKPVVGSADGIANISYD